MFLSVYRGWFIGLSSLVYRFIGFGLSVYRVWFIGLSVYRFYRFIGLSGMGVYRFIGLSVYRFIGLSVYRVWVYRFIGYIMQAYIYIYMFCAHTAGPRICKACRPTASCAGTFSVKLQRSQHLQSFWLACCMLLGILEGSGKNFSFWAKKIRNFYKKNKNHKKSQKPINQ